MSWVATLQRKQVPKSSLQVTDPPGFSATSHGGKKGKQVAISAASTSVEDRETLMVKKAWDLAIAPLKALPMSAIMTYFSGSSIQIFSVMMTASLFTTPIKVLAAKPTEVFNPLDTPGTHSRLTLPKVVFILGQLLSIVLGMIKLQYMGLLPTTTSDWLAFQTYEPVPEWSTYLS